MSYADGTAELYEYDANGNPTQTTQANGTVINQTFDAVSRLVSRVIIPALGVLGPTAETFAYDGLDRLVTAQSGVVTQRTYDSLSRMLSETTDGRTLTYGYDLADSLASVTYPSGHQLRLWPDDLGRTRQIDAEGGAEWKTRASYGFQGASRVARRDVGSSVRGTFEYDDAGRLETRSAQNLFDSTVFGERASWTPRGLKAVQSRTDLNGKSLRFGYDGAGRLLDAEHTASFEDSTPFGSVGGVPGQFAFTYDEAQNLLSRSTELVCEDTGVELPLDASGRNRPGQVGATSLTWDPQGNLASKGSRTFHYDYRNRLTEVRDGATVVASYTYDAFNRRLTRTTGGVSEETTWSHWQPIETYWNGQLSSRRTYGLGLDEIVSIERDPEADGTLNDETLPFYDSTGNLALITDVNGKPIERYTYSPYGEQWIHVDSTAPVLEQVRIKDGKVQVEMSEEIQLEGLEKAITAGTLFLTNLTLGETIALEVSQPITSGRQARRRFVLEPKTASVDFWPTAEDQAHLVIPASALKDLFGNTAAAGYRPRCHPNRSRAEHEIDAAHRADRVEGHGVRIAARLDDHVLHHEGRAAKVLSVRMLDSPGKQLRRKCQYQYTAEPLR